MAAVTSLLGNLSRLLTSHADLISGTAEEIEIQRLIKELVLLKDVFKEFARDAEDTVDSCLTHLTAAKYSNIVWRRRCRPDLNPRPPVNLAQEVKSITEDKLKPLLDKLVSRTEFGDTQKKALSITRDNIVGFQDEERRIITYLMDEGEELDVVSIVGMPGLGKTTLAWKFITVTKSSMHSPPASGLSSLKNSPGKLCFSVFSKNSPAKICLARVIAN